MGGYVGVDVPPELYFIFIIDRPFDIHQDMHMALI
jgi:hypothetical protein